MSVFVKPGVGRPPVNYTVVPTADGTGTGRVVTGASDVAYAVGGVPGQDQRTNAWATVQPPKAVTQKQLDATVSTQPAAIAAKKAADQANAKQAADVANGVVSDSAASQAGVAARAAILDATKAGTGNILFALGVAAVAALGLFFFWRHKHKHKQ